MNVTNSLKYLLGIIDNQEYTNGISTIPYLYNGTVTIPMQEV